MFFYTKLKRGAQKMHPFSKACRDGNFTIVKTMLETYKRSRTLLLQLTEANGWNCLHWAAWHSDVETMKYLLTLKELDVSVMDSSGRTALQIALLPRTEHIHQNERGRLGYPRHPSYDIVKMLLDVRSDVFSCFNADRASTLIIALMCHHFDVIKLLIDCRGFVEYSKSVFWHIAAMYQRVDCMRYLLCKAGYDPKVRDSLGWQACFIFFQNMLSDTVEPLNEEIAFGVELLLLTVDSPADSIELYFVLLDCFRLRHTEFNNDNRVYRVFMEMVKLLLPQHPRKNLVAKILRVKLPSCYVLVTLIMFPHILIVKSKSMLASSVVTRYLEFLDDLKSYFLHEMFSLYSADKEVFRECIEEVMKLGWSFDKLELVTFLCLGLPRATSPQILFDFTKSLVLHKFNFLPKLIASPNMIRSRMKFMDNYLMNVFVPLSNFVNAPIDLMMMLRCKKVFCHYNFSESDNCINDFEKLLSRKSDQFEVVSLKHLSRMSVRKQIFGALPLHEALSTMYSLNIPVDLRQFLCYNRLNLKF